MNLLQIVQSVCKQLALPQPSGAFSENDDMVEQIVILTQEAGDDLMRDHDWSTLTVVRSFTATNDQVQNEPPSASVAFDRFAQNSGVWDLNNKRKLSGPKTPLEWQRVLIDNLNGVDKAWTLIGGSLNIFPVPESTDSFTYTYITKNWIRLDGRSQVDDVSAWTDDSNTPLMPDRLIKLSTIWRWKQAKGLDYAEDMATFEREKARYIGRDRGPRIISTTHGIRDDRFHDYFWPNVIGE